MDKIRELRHIEHFREICDFFPEGGIETSEKPDFVVHARDRLLGIEHTEIFQPDSPDGVSPQAQDALAQRVVERARELYSQRHNYPLYVQIMFRPRQLLKKSGITQLAERIVRLIENTPLEVGSVITLRRTRGNIESFPGEIAMIHLSPRSHEEVALWRCSSAGFVPVLDEEHLQQKISIKEQKFDSYITQCSELWLLIVADDSRLPSSLSISKSASIHRYQTRFNRVFMFWDSVRQYVELPIERYTEDVSKSA